MLDRKLGLLVSTNIDSRGSFHKRGSTIGCVFLPTGERIKLYFGWQFHPLAGLYGLTVAGVFPKASKQFEAISAMFLPQMSFTLV